MLLGLSGPSTAFVLDAPRFGRHRNGVATHTAAFDGSLRRCRRPFFPIIIPFLSPSLAAVNGEHSRPDATATDGDNGSAVPKHVAFVCDGNSRWASSRNLPQAAGHAAGADRLIQILDALKGSGVTYCTFYAFSTENWNRPASETRDILDVMERTAKQLYGRLLKEENVRLRVLGDLDDVRIPGSLRDVLEQLVSRTDEATRDRDDALTLSVAVNYGGRQDIVNAAKRMARAAAAGEIDIDDGGGVTEEYFASLLGTSGVPDPDLIIRTSGESRLSNFLLWNAAYSELYFTKTLWPDFDRAALSEALDWFARRRRRFGTRAGADAKAPAAAHLQP